MREILFKGKRVDTGEWIEAHSIVREQRPEGPRYYLTQKEPVIIVYDWDQVNILAVRGKTEGPALYQVEPESIGQWTGLEDKNGVKIFEGDLLRWTNAEGEPSDFTVKWNNKKQGYYTYELSTGYGDTYNAIIARECTMIGNTYDNKTTGGETNGFIQL